MLFSSLRMFLASSKALCKSAVVLIWLNLAPMPTRVSARMAEIPARMNDVSGNFHQAPVTGLGAQLAGLSANTAPGFQLGNDVCALLGVQPDPECNRALTNQLFPLIAKQFAESFINFDEAAVIESAKKY